MLEDTGKFPREEGLSFDTRNETDVVIRTRLFLMKGRERSDYAVRAEL